MNADYTVSNHGSLFLLAPVDADAERNLTEHVSDEGLWFGGRLVVEPRYIGPLVEQLREEGWVVA